jgi:Fe-S-cluster containining protein
MEIDSPDMQPLPAGNFSDWLRAMRAALSSEGGMDVACGDCRGCCTSSYYIKVRAGEAAALARIGEANLEAEPARDGSRLMGFRENGHCLMLLDRTCSIYSDRPETCRAYDCRVYTASGMDAGEGRQEINARIARWRFDYPTERDREEQRAVTAVANHLRQHPVRFPGGRIPSRASEIAVLAVKAYTVFLDSPPEEADISAAIVGATLEFNRAARQKRSEASS